MTSEQLEEIKKRNDRAFDMVSALCQPKGSPGSREWIMSVPARLDHDPDVVIGVALGDTKDLLAYIKRLWRERDLYLRHIRRERSLYNTLKALHDSIPLVIESVYELDDEAFALLNGEKGGVGA